MPKHHEHDADILVEFDTINSGVFKVYWKKEDKLDGEDYASSTEEGTNTPPNDSVLSELGV
eukprot:snap_masked-scaffold_10-processed-gene-13.40-mRNA-1 protein AED:1.00 eAED:1.00 QI:0/0/0/0/1/1/2/0/60